MDNSKYTDGIDDHLKALIKQDVNSGIDRPVTTYLQCALETLKRRYQAMNKWGHQPWSSESTAKTTKLWGELEPKLAASIEKHLYEFKHKKLTKDIRATSAKATIRAAMQEAGLKHQFVGQTHRAKVSVLLTKNKALTFYVSYKKLNEQLPHIIKSLKLIRQELECFGNNISINKVYNIAEWE